MIKKIIGYINWKITWYFEEYRVDKKFGIETRMREGLDPEQARDAQWWYEPVKWRHFSEIIDKTPINYSDYIFVDVGSGKGRALIFATQYNFKCIIGVEISERLHNIALSNVELFESKYGQKSNIELNCCDICDFEFPAGNLVVWMYNPFNGDAMQKFLTEFSDHCSGTGSRAYLCYRIPKCKNEIDSRGDFMPVLHGQTGTYSIYKFSYPSGGIEVEAQIPASTQLSL